MKNLLLIIPAILILGCSSKPDSEFLGMNKVLQENNIETDGFLTEPAWKDANTDKITVSEDWIITINYFQDDEHLYFAFSNLKLNDSTEIYPEVLLDCGNDKSETWDENDWWFHTSYSNCENQARFNDYSTCEIGNKKGWMANNFPLGLGQAVEIKIEKSLLDLPSSGTIGIAFDVTDTQKFWYFSSPKAQLENPSTWRTIQL